VCVSCVSVCVCVYRHTSSTQTPRVGEGGGKEPSMTVHTVMRSTTMSQCSGTET